MIEQSGSGALRAFLDRFRRQAAVPAQAADDLAAELRPLFAALDALDREADALREAAARREGERDAAAAARLDELRAAGGRNAAAARRRAAARTLRSYDAEAAAVAEAGRAEASRIRAAGPGRIDALAEKVVELVFEARE